MTIYGKTYDQIYRVADDSLEQYEMYLGEEAMPDFDDSTQPVATSATLPFDYTPTPPGSGDTTQLYIVIRKRNKFNLVSLNQWPIILEIDELGEEVLGPLTDPEILKIRNDATGQIKVTARYPSGVDQWSADTWELFAKAGSDPDPDIDSPNVVKAFNPLLGTDYVIHETITGLTPGIEYHIMATVIRSDDSDGERGISSVSTFTPAETVNLDEEDAGIY